MSENIIATKKKRTKSQIEYDAQTNTAYYNNEFYRIPPTEEIQLAEFENYAIERLTILKHMENMRIRGIFGQEYESEVKKLIKSTRLDLDPKRDIIGHFTLRLAFSRMADRKWLITNEANLMKIRLQMKSPEELAVFTKKNGFNFELVSFDEKQRNYNDLCDIYDKKITEATTFYKIPFEEAIDLVKHRRVFLLRGWAFIPLSDLPTIITGHFRAELSESLARAYQALGTMQSRLVTISPFLNALSTLNTESDYKVDTSKRSGKIEVGQIDMLAKRSFPMCMKSLHWRLKEKHHLKHMGRMQYGLFLKGIGLSLDDALTFWRNEFCKIMGIDKFDKSYAYNIRHNYGREGRRTDYTPYSCFKIISGAVTAGESHGCPFRHFDSEALRATMANFGVNSSGIQQVLDLVKGNHYQIACAKYFELTHPGTQNIVIQHPNHYFDESEKYYESPRENPPTTNVNNEIPSVSKDTMEVN